MPHRSWAVFSGSSGFSLLASCWQSRFNLCGTCCAIDRCSSLFCMASMLVQLASFSRLSIDYGQLGISQKVMRAVSVWGIIRGGSLWRLLHTRVQHGMECRLSYRLLPGRFWDCVGTVLRNINNRDILSHVPCIVPKDDSLI